MYAKPYGQFNKLGGGLCNSELLINTQIASFVNVFLGRAKITIGEQAHFVGLLVIILYKDIQYSKQVHFHFMHSRSLSCQSRAAQF